MEYPHLYILGGSGTGKSTHLKHLMLDAISAGHGVLYLDPHGHDTDDLLDRIPRRRRADTILFDPTDYPLAWNPLDRVPLERRPFIASTFVDTVRTISKLTAGGTATMDMYTYASVATLMETGGTLADIPALLRDKDTRAGITDTLKDTVLSDFWQQFEDLSGKEQREATSSTYNKFWPLVADPRIRQVIGHQQSSFSMGDVLEGRVFFARLPQGKLGIGKTAMLGSLLLSQAHAWALDRSPRVPFHFFIDEAHTWAPSIIAELLSGVRKFGGRVVVAHQFIDQLDRQLFTSLVGNCPSKHIFRVSREDGERFQRRFNPQDTALNLDELPDFIYRIFPYEKRDVDGQVVPLGPVLRRSRDDIEARMRFAGG